MATWRCPNCRTVQADSSRCFLCGRSATSCGTCANFRQSVVGGLGFCGLDKKRAPLSGDEQRACWAGSSAGPADSIFAAMAEATDNGLVTVRPPRGSLRPVTGR